MSSLLPPLPLPARFQSDREREENIHHNIGHYYPPWEKFYKSYRLENLTCQTGPEKQEGNIKIKMRYTFDQSWSVGVDKMIALLLCPHMFLVLF